MVRENDENQDYVALIEAPAEVKESETVKLTLPHFLAGAIAWGCEAGNFPNAYFNLLLTAQTLTEIFLEIQMNDDLSPSAKAACYLLTGHFVLNTLINDLFLVIPAEIYQTIYEKLTVKNSIKIELNRSQRLVQWLKRIFLIIIYTSISILSAGGAIGAVEIFFLPVLKQTLGVFAAAIGTLLGIGYAHFYYTDSILEAIDFFSSCIKRPLATLRSIYANPGPSLQIAKSFIIVSFHYSTMGVFYLTRFAETICSIFEITEKKPALISVMKMTGAFMLVTNGFIRFVPIKKRYLSDNKLESADDFVLKRTQFPWGFIIDIFLESIVSGAIVVFSQQYLNKIYLGIVVGSISLVVRLSIKEPTKDQYPPFSKISTWINFNARLHKSAVLLMVALSHIQNMMRNYAGVDLEMSISDLGCLAMIIGISIAKNRFEVDNNKLDKHILYFKKKQEFKHFGTLANIFKPAAAFPADQKEQLLQIIKR